MLDLLKTILPEELFNQVTEATKGHEKELAQYIPKSRFDEVNLAKKELDKQYNELKATSEKYADYDALKETVEKYADYDTLQDKITNLTVEGRKAQLSKLGLDDAFIEFALGKIDPEKFDESAAEFVKSNPKYIKDNYNPINSGLNLSGGQTKNIAEMDTPEFLEYRKTHNVDGSAIKK